MGRHRTQVDAIEHYLSADSRGTSRPTGQRIDQGRLAGTVGTDHAKHLASPHLDLINRQRSISGISHPQTIGLKDNRIAGISHAVRPR
jgi:hypothetical protein